MLLVCHFKLLLSQNGLNNYIMMINHSNNNILGDIRTLTMGEPAMKQWTSYVKINYKALCNFFHIITKQCIYKF